MVGGDERPIGVFDSGIGGLTVLRALRARMPAEDFLYLGDTARLPYGTKTPATVERYALQAAALLVGRGIKCLVVACNTAAAAALPAMQARFSGLPVLGVIEPGAAAACATTRNGRIAVIATQGTVSGGAYQAAIARLRPQMTVSARAAQLFVALAEEGWTDGEIAEAAARRYLDPLFGAATRPETRPDTLVLGCTHFPLLAAVIGSVVGSAVQLVDSAAPTAEACRESLQNEGSARDPQEVDGRVRFFATDGERRFAEVGSGFLGEHIAASAVERVDLGRDA